MKRIRVIPLIMIDNGKAVVTRQFGAPIYVGDPINAIKILNDKEVDELFILDITSKRKRAQPDFSLLEDMASESFMPLAYGGHIASVEVAERIIKCGIEKISFNTSLFYLPKIVESLSARIGKQSVIASLDIKKNWLGHYRVYTKNGSEKVEGTLQQVVARVLSLGVGEILLTSIDRDGTRTGYDLELLRQVTAEVNIPVVACGGAHTISDFRNAVSLGGASAVAAGAMFFFKGGFNSVLVNYPDPSELEEQLYQKI